MRSQSRSQSESRAQPSDAADTTLEELEAETDLGPESEPRPDVDTPASTAAETDAMGSAGSGTEADAEPERTANANAGPSTVYEHASAVVDERTERVRFLDDENDVVGETAAGDVSSALEAFADEEVPTTIVLDDILSQQVLDLAADRGVDRIVARSLGQFTKRPTGVRIHASDDIADEPPAE